MRKLLLPAAAALTLAALLSGCKQANTGDEPAASSVPTGIERFLLFPNPVAPDLQTAQTVSTYETNTDAYAEAYYHAVDPANAKDTLDKWKAQNNFGGNTGTEHLVVFRDTRDLGYGRRMTGRRNADGSIAFFVENYDVTNLASGGYNSLNVEAAVARDTRWHIGTNAIEWSPAPCTAEDPADCDPNVKFAKYYNFSSKDGTRQLRVDLDGKGLKAMPGPCITCHGGRGDALTPVETSTGKPRFPLVENTLSRKRGDVQARLQGLNVGSFGFSSQAGFTRTDQEAKLKDFNQWVLCTYPLPSPSALAEDQCRIAAGPNEWQGPAAEIIKAWYGGDGMPQATFSDNYVPAAWNGNPSLYTDVVAPFCRTCHLVRGTVNQSDIDFATLAKFQGYADRIKAHVFDRGNMPLALIVYDDFWRSSAPQTLATYLDSVLGAQTATTASGAALAPGRPVANPGPNRMVRTSTNATLSGANSLFATSYTWAPVSGPTTPLITSTGSTSSEATFNASTAGAYTVRLTVSDGARADSKDVTITVDDTFPDPSTIRFAQIQNVMQNVLHNGTTTCVSCHSTPPGSPTPPVFYNVFDRDGSGATDATDVAWFLKQITGRVNLTEIDASPLLRKPSGNHHNGGTLFDLATAAGLRNYSIFYNWILAGMPAGGVVANAGADTSETVTFSGSPLSASFPLDGSQSIGATSFVWSVVSGPNGPAGTPPSITNATLSASTLNVFNVGTYVIQLQVSDSVSTDTDQRTITVSENPITASFTPPTGTTVVSFSGAPSRGNITLTSTSTGSPANCRWQVISGPAGATLDGSATLDVTKSCGTSATLNVPSSAIGGTYQVQLTASNIGSNSVTHSITVGNGTPVVASIVVNSGVTPVVRTFSGGTPSTGAASTASLLLDGSGSSGVLPLTFSWSVTTQPDSTNGAATLSNATASAPTLTVRATGSYTVRLQVTDSASNTAVTTSTFNVNPTNGTTFATMTTLFGPVASGGIGCTGCHAGTGANPTNNSGTAPSWQNLTGSDGSTLWRRVFQRIAVGVPANSLLLLNPENVTNTINTNGHGGGCQSGFGCGIGGSGNITPFSNWITDGGPPGN